MIFPKMNIYLRDGWRLSDNWKEPDWPAFRRINVTVSHTSFPSTSNVNINGSVISSVTLTSQLANWISF